MEVVGLRCVYSGYIAVTAAFTRGGGTTEIAVISLSGIVFAKSIRIGGDEFDESIMSHLKKAYNLMIGERTAEEIKIRIGSAYPLEEETTLDVKGRDVLAGLAKTISVTSEEIREALSEPLSAILEAVRIALERTPPELSAKNHLRIRAKRYFFCHLLKFYPT